MGSYGWEVETKKNFPISNLRSPVSGCFPQTPTPGGLFCTPKRTAPVGSMCFFKTKKHPTSHKVTTLHSRRGPQFGFRRCLGTFFFFGLNTTDSPEAGLELDSRLKSGGSLPSAAGISKVNSTTPSVLWAENMRNANLGKVYVDICPIHI